MFEKGVVPLSGDRLNGKGLRVLIVHTRWNLEIVQALVEGTRSTLEQNHVSDIDVVDVPGAFELPFAAKRLIEASKQSARPYDAAVCIGVLIKGSTMHFEYICEATSQGIMNVGLQTGCPVIFGVLTCLNDEQAHERAGIGRGSSKGHNHGIDWGQAAIEMARLGKTQN
ncbi:6,7-dimethyl-8-ribityllumazine synthase [Polychytrium aggregatum]|uniref:6,7-dimethyl-8-ribityllumazine synthase n=1 Tax=Polychytrium aggregatum TaxID=110093 RepID=UPI0022FDD608|nr:6,7-dimethyl-8-ribityllumazine synthase [Polychytrium aggregatum]KAI9202322.1 6,7-dimethyl-8-ribityllumazine synthase [Polychytrium aggregatum]